MSAIHRTLFNAIYVSQTGVQGLTRSKIEGLSIGQPINPFQKISLLAANFAIMQQRTAAFGFIQHWHKMAKEEFSLIAKDDFDKTNKEMIINLDEPPILTPFTLDDLQADFLVLFVMLGVSIVTLALEIYIFKRNGKKQIKK